MSEWLAIPINPDKWSSTVLNLGTTVDMQCLNRLTPNDPYMGRTAPLTSKRCILYI